MTPVRRQNAKRAYYLRRIGLEWKAIGKVVGQQRLTIYASVKTYAEQEGLPWPLPRWSKGRMCYELFEEGMTREEIIEETKLKVDYPSQVTQLAEKWAERNGKPWPLKH